MKAVYSNPIKNFHRVANTLFRSAQPTRRGMEYLKAIGVKTVINLRHWHTDTKEIGDLKLRDFHIVFATMWPEDRDVNRFLKIMRDKRNWPCLVHCLHGSDRTGTMCAISRIEVEGWSIRKALKEMRDPKYGHHRLFVHLPAFIRRRYGGKIKGSAT